MLFPIDFQLLDHLSNSTHKIEISTGFTRDESLELFSKVLSIPIDKLPQEAVDLHHICKSNPFYISLIANNLKEYTTSPLIRWSHWKKIFQNNEYAQFIKHIIGLFPTMDNVHLKHIF